MSTGNPFFERYKKLSNAELLKIVNTPENYQPLAVETAAAELEARGLSEDELNDAQNVNNAELEAAGQKRKNNLFYKIKTDSTGTAMVDALNPIQYGPVSVQRLILRLSLIVAFLTIVNLFNHYSLIVYKIHYSK